MEAIEAFVRKAAVALVPGVECVTCGSYRWRILFKVGTGTLTFTNYKER